MKPIRSRDIRESNEKLILRLIREGKGISQSDVVVQTGLRAPTVLRFFNYFEKQGFILRVEREPVLEKRGRKPVYYEPNPRAFYAMGMEFWAYSASASIIDFSGEVIFSRSWPLNPDNRSDIPVLLESLFSESLKDSGIHMDKLLGLCIAAPGQIDIDTGQLVQYSRMGIADINLKTVLEQKIGVPVIVQNNSAAVAWDEYRRGAGRGVQSLFTVMIRAGVGGAFLDNNDIFVTKTHTTLEIGHISVEYNGRLCDCGSRGCLETYLSEGAILQDMACCAELKTITDIDSLLAEGREDVQKILDEKAGLLAQAVRTLISLFGPEMFLIITRSYALSCYLANAVHDLVKYQASRRWQGHTVIKPALYDAERAGRGAANLVYKNFFEC